MGKVVAIVNQKGGVGKTTTTVNLAASLAVGEHRVLVIDFDPQGNASSALGVEITPEFSTKTIYQCLVAGLPMEEAVRKTEIDGLSVVPANSNLAGAELELVSAFSRENKLKMALSTIRDKYDFILIDCPPSLGLLTINAFTASDSYLVPLQAEYFALEGLSSLMTTVHLIRQSTNPDLKEEGILLTMFAGNRLAHEVEKEVRGHFGTIVYQTVVPRNIKLSECTSFGKPILLYDIDSKGCLAYLNLAKEFLNKNRPQISPPPFVVEDARSYFLPSGASASDAPSDKKYVSS